MPSSFGNALRVSVFGQSHSAAIGCVIEGLPSGMTVDTDALAAHMARRASGKMPWDTPRKEADQVRILSGLNARGATCGAPLALMIENANTRPSDYAAMKDIPRPGHADFTAWAKWHGNQDASGGGHFSGRLTAPLTAAGAICLQALSQRGIRMAAHACEVAGIEDEVFAAMSCDDASKQKLAAQMDTLEKTDGLPVLNPVAAEAMADILAAARAKGISVGGIVECVATGLPAGAGSPMFDGIENTIARALFGIPAVKGVEFGAGFASARLTGDANNDPFEVADGFCVPATNNAGGILGGITTGAPVLVRCAIKPIPSIALEQDSVDLATMEPAKLTIRGRHDACAVFRAVPVVESVVACALLDTLLSWPAE